MHPACIEWLRKRGIPYQPIPCPVFQRWLELQHQPPSKDKP